jgi:putative transposase
MDELMERYEIDDATPIVRLLDRQEIVADLDRHLLSQDPKILLAANTEALRESQGLEQRDDIAAHLSGLSQALPSAEYTGYMAFKLLELQGLDGRRYLPARQQTRKRPSKRTLRRWRAQAQRNNGNVEQPRWSNCGTRDELRSPVHNQYLDSHIASARRDPNFCSVKATYITYRRAFPEFSAEHDLGDETPVSQSTYYTLWKSKSAALGAYERGGRRLQNALGDAFDPKKRTLIATRPFAAAHIDHCLLKIQVVVGQVNEKPICQRPWLTAMVDAYTGEFLGIWMGFSAPSRKQCAMVIRDCVRRHGRVPAMIIVDGGAEFGSAHAHVMAAALKYDRCERPPEDPRFGVEVERAFGAFKERFLRGLPGFGVGTGNARQVSAALKPERRATLTPEALFECLERFIFNGYNRTPRREKLRSPVDLRLEAIRRLPCCGRVAEWGLDVLTATSIEAPAARYTLWPGRGVHILDRWYCSERLLAYRGKKQDIEVRLEPYDRSVVYVNISGTWSACYSQEYARNRAADPETVLVQTTLTHDLRELAAEIRLETDARLAELVQGSLANVARKQEGRKADRPPDPDGSVAAPSTDAPDSTKPEIIAQIETLPFDED